jgi:hypothetical protein
MNKAVKTLLIVSRLAIGGAFAQNAPANPQQAPAISNSARCEWNSAVGATSTLPPRSFWV